MLWIMVELALIVGCTVEEVVGHLFKTLATFAGCLFYQ